MTQPTNNGPLVRTSTTGLRAVVSIVETLSAVAGVILASLNNGSDTHSALIAGLVALTAHGVNHNVGNSPI